MYPKTRSSCKLPSLRWPKRLWPCLQNWCTHINIWRRKKLRLAIYRTNMVPQESIVYAWRRRPRSIIAAHVTSEGVWINVFGLEVWLTVHSKAYTSWIAHNFGTNVPYTKYEEDGSFEVIISHQEPENREEINWLPIPADGAWMCIRFYAPTQQVIDLEYEIPGIEKIN